MSAVSNRGRLVSALRGPILLLTLGLLFSLDHFGPYRFASSWPVLLIVLGVLKLLERAGPSPPSALSSRGPLPGPPDLAGGSTPSS